MSVPYWPVAPFSTYVASEKTNASNTIVASTLFWEIVLSVSRFHVYAFLCESAIACVLGN